MKVVHVASYNYLKDGQTYYAIDYKIHNGFTRNGHMVYPFSYRDNARCGNIFGSKRFGGKKVNLRLIETCQNIRPELLLLSHAEMITPQTLESLRKLFPCMKIARWFVDPLWLEHHRQNIQSKLPYVDHFFATTDGEYLLSLVQNKDKLHFFPNTIDASIDFYKNFEAPKLTIDFIFCGRDYKEPERQQFLIDLSEKLSNLQTYFFGCLGNSLIFGNDYMRVLSQSSMGLSYNRRNDVEKYCSDRIAHLTGNGILTFTPRVPGLCDLYTEDEVVYFDSVEELTDKATFFSQHDDLRRKVAHKGWLKGHSHFETSRVTDYMEHVIFGVKSDINIISKFIWGK